LEEKFPERKFKKIRRKIYGDHYIEAILSFDSDSDFEAVMREPKNDIYIKCLNKLKKKKIDVKDRMRFYDEMRKAYNEVTYDLINLEHETKKRKTGPKVDYAFHFLFVYLVSLLKSLKEGMEYSLPKIIGGFLQEQKEKLSANLPIHRGYRTIYNQIEKWFNDKDKFEELKAVYDYYQEMFLKFKLNNEVMQLSMDRSNFCRRIIMDSETGQKYIAFPNWEELFIK
jgi:hypothetical protein